LKEVKTIKDRKSIRVWTFVFVSMLILLLSSMIGTTVWAKGKPDKPGKPEQPEAADFEIRIGNGELNSPEEEDVVLQPYDGKDYLLVEDWLGGYWLPPPTKGKVPREGWSIFLGQQYVGNDYCGTYDINDQSLIEALNDNEAFDINNQDVYMLYIRHCLEEYWTEDNPRPSKADFWHLIIQWEVGTWIYPNPPLYVIPRFLILSGNTNMDTEWEGTYDENADTWTVTFDNAEFELYENTTEPDDPDTGSVLNKLWDGQLSFTVEIKRTTS
jgi:hypothetical protein